jgi:hypothetical protein
MPMTGEGGDLNHGSDQRAESLSRVACPRFLNTSLAPKHHLFHCPAFMNPAFLSIGIAGLATIPFVCILE